MKKITNTPILETLGKGDFRVDIVLDTDEMTYSAWLYHKDYGVKELMFGIPMYQSGGGFQTLEEMEGLVEHNLKQYIHSYEEAYIDC